MPSRKKNTKLRGKTRILASKYIAEEVLTGKYSMKQAVAVGISRAKAKVKKLATAKRKRKTKSKTKNTSSSKKIRR